MPEEAVDVAVEPGREPSPEEKAQLGRVLTVPNLITGVRLACIPLFVWLLFGAHRQTAAAVLLAVLGATDWVDGYVARRWHQVSTIGKVLDPTADRLLVATGVICIIVDGAVPVWLGVVTLVREALVSMAVLLLAALGAERIDVLWVGKAGTFGLMFAYPAFLLAHGNASWQHPIEVVAWLSVVPGLILGWIAAAAYVPLSRRSSPGKDGASGVDPSIDAGRGSSMKAVIMAGGEGTRLRPLTSNQPKPMLPMANRPMMEHVVDLLRGHGFDDIVVTVAFMANSIRSYFDDGSEFGVRMVYATEESPLGTAGSVRNAEEQLDERFLVISGDVLTDVNLSAVLEAHDANKALATIALKAVEDPLEFGIVITREDGSIERFLEKPTWGQVFSDTINTGIYVLEPDIFDYIPAGRSVDFSEEVFPAVLTDGRPLFGHVVDGYWEDVGTLDAYQKAHRDILDQRVQVAIDGFPLRPGIWLGKGADVHPTAHVEGPALIGDNCSVGPGASVGEYCVLGANVQVRENSALQRTVAHDNAVLGPGTRLDGCVIGRSCDLRQGVRCEEGVVLGDETLVGAQAVIKSGVKIYPFKTVESGATINTSIVWESRGARTLFGRLGIQGLANVDITPELVMRLAMAWASTLEKGSTVTMSRDTSRAARVLKRALMVGCNAAGVHVEDLEVATIPVTRFQVRLGSSRGGITVRLAENDSQSVVLRFLAEDGIDVAEATQRKIERLYHREEFRRAKASDIGDIGFPPRTLEFYTAALMDAVDVAAIADVGFKLVLDYSFGTTSFVMPNVLAKLGAEVLVVNPYAATASAAVASDRTAPAANVAQLVRASGAHLGAVLDPGGECITLVDDEGRVLSNDEALVLMVGLFTATSPGRGVALPVAAPRAAEQLCATTGAPVVWTKLSPTHIMEVAGYGGVGLGASQLGGFIFPAFLPAFDSVAAFVHLLAMLAATGQRMSKLTGDLAPIHIAHEEVITPWEQKGSVMRQTVEMAKDHSTVLVDGVKLVEPDGWILVVPDPEEAVTHVWAEAVGDHEARAKAQEQAVRIRQMMG